MLKIALIRLTKGSLIYGVGGMLQRFMGLLLLPFFTRVLSPEDYGVVALISLVSVAIVGLFNLGTVNSMGILYFREQAQYRRPTVIWSNTLLMAVNAVVWCVILYLAAPTLSSLIFQTERYAELIRLAVLGLAFATVADPWRAYLRMEEKSKRYVTLTLISSLLSIGLSIWFVLIQRIGVTGVILAGTMTQGMMLLVYWVTIGRQLPFHVDKSLFIPLVRIGFPSIFSLFSSLLIDYADRQMVERMLGLDALGVYSVGYNFGMVATIAMGAFATAWPPFFMSYIHKRDEARVIFGRVLTYYLVGSSVLIVLFFFAAKPIVVLFTAPVFHDAYVVVGLVAAAYMIKGCYLILLPGFYFTEQLHKQVGLEWVAAIVNIGLNLWLIPIYGILGAAIATFVCYLTLSFLAWVVGQRYLVVDYQWLRVLKITGVVVLASYLLAWLSSKSDLNFEVILAINTGVLLAFFGVVYGILLTSSERKMIWNKFKGMRV
jgi:O-antigen/teichoic acid export membrane protein